MFAWNARVAYAYQEGKSTSGGWLDDLSRARETQDASQHHQQNPPIFENPISLKSHRARAQQNVHVVERCRSNQYERSENDRPAQCAIMKAYAAYRFRTS
jgi:hypothetical protein